MLEMLDVLMGPRETSTDDHPWHRAERGEIPISRLQPDVAPFAASPLLQEALVLERQDRFGPAIRAARSAAEKEPTNWLVWVTLSRLLARVGKTDASIATYRRARSLNPRSPFFD